MYEVNAVGVDQIQTLSASEVDEVSGGAVPAVVVVAGYVALGLTGLAVVGVCVGLAAAYMATH